MKTIVAMFLLLLAPSAKAQMASADPAQLALATEVRETAQNIIGMMSAMMNGADKDSVDVLNKKLRLMKTIRNEMGEENLLRLQLFEEMQTFQMGVQLMGYGNRFDAGTSQARLDMLKKIEKVMGTVVDQKEFRRIKERGESGSAKGNLSSIRSALQVYYGDNEGVFPASLSALTDKSKYITSIPFIKLPGHDNRINAVKYVSGVKTLDELKKSVDDAGGWLYVNDKASQLFGTVIINCSHADITNPKQHVYDY